MQGIRLNGACNIAFQLKFVSNAEKKSLCDVFSENFCSSDLLSVVHCILFCSLFYTVFSPHFLQCVPSMNTMQPDINVSRLAIHAPIRNAYWWVVKLNQSFLAHQLF